MAVECPVDPATQTPQNQIVPFREMGGHVSRWVVAIPDDPGAGDALLAQLPAVHPSARLDRDGDWAVISLPSASTVLTGSVAAFVRSRFGSGLVLDLTRDPPAVSVDLELPPGVLATLRPGEEEAASSPLGDQQIGYLLRAGLATRGL